MGTRLNAAHRAEVLKRERELEAELFGPHSEDELREAEAFLRRDPAAVSAQPELPLELTPRSQP